jgi:hypothetical protein
MRASLKYLWTTLLAACGAEAPLEPSKPTINHEAAAEAAAVAISAFNPLTSDDESDQEIIASYGGPSCEQPVAVRLDDDRAPQWAVICSQASTCGNYSQFFLVDLDAERPILHRSEEYYSAYFSQRIEARDVDRDGRDEVIVASTSQDPNYGASVGLEVWQRQGESFANLWRPAQKPGDEESPVFTLDYELVDVDRDGQLDVVTTVSGYADESELLAEAKQEVWSWDEDGMLVRRQALDHTEGAESARQRWLARYETDY